MFDVFDDLEQQAAGLGHAERDAEVAELSVAEYAHVGLLERLHASKGRELVLSLRGGARVSGRLARLGADWLLLVGDAGEWVVRLDGVLTLAGVSARARDERTWAVLDRLSLRSVLRRLGSLQDTSRVHLLDAQLLEGRVGRVGGDFLELHTGHTGQQSGVLLVPVGAIVALQRCVR